MRHLLNKAGQRRLPATVAAVLVVLIGGVLFTWWTVARTDREMREDRLHAARLVAQSVNLDRLRALSGTEADLDAPDYLRLKEQFARVAGADENCRFIYLLGRKVDGRVFFWADNEPAGSEDESPAGQIYEEISAEYLRAFDEQTAVTEGPVTDRWGTWISALVPLKDPHTGELIAMLGMDVDAGTWKAMLLRSALPPLGLTLALMVIVLVFSLLVAQQATTKTEREQMLAMFEGMNEVIYVADPQTYELLYMNAPAKKAWGDRLGEPCYRVLQNRDTPCPFCTNERIFGEHTGQTYVWEFQNTNNRRWYRCTDRAIRWSDGRMVRFEMAIDIDDAKRADETVRASEERFRSVVEATPNCVKLFDEEGRYLAINSNGLEVMGWNEDDILGKRFVDVWPEKIQPIVEDAIKCVLRGERASFEADCVRPDGSAVYWWVMLNPIVEQDGSIRRFVGISTDVTERKQAERATRQARDEAEASAKRATQAMRDMERMHAATVGREARIMEMKREVNELLAELGRAHRYQHT